MSNKNNVGLKILILLFFIAGVVCLYNYSGIKDFSFLGNTTKTVYENKVTVTDTGIADAVEKVYNAVVVIENYNAGRLQATGSGFVYKIDKNNAYILTNYHVINGYTSLKAVMTDNTSRNAKFLGGDEFLDIAVLSMPNEGVKTVAVMGDSTKTRLGDTVFTIGTPVDTKYMGTVTRGILSGKDRLVDVENYVMKVLQTDAAINSGNSGGPLLNVNGEVIGINSLKIVQDTVEGMGFAIPIEDVMQHIESFEKGESLLRPYLGIELYNLNENYAIRENIKYGIVVASVDKNAPAYGKLQNNDIITEINGEKVYSLSYFRYELYKYNVGDTIELSIIRNGKAQKVKLELNKKAE